MNLWRVTFSHQTGRKVYHNVYFAVAASAAEAQAKTVAYLGYAAPETTITVEVLDEEGVAPGRFYTTKA